jgi:hypothetical protein
MELIKKYGPEISDINKSINKETVKELIYDKIVKILSKYSFISVSEQIQSKTINISNRIIITDDIKLNVENIKRDKIIRSTEELILRFEEVYEKSVNELINEFVKKVNPNLFYNKEVPDSYEIFNTKLLIKKEYFNYNYINENCKISDFFKIDIYDDYMNMTKYKNIDLSIKMNISNVLLYNEYGKYVFVGEKIFNKYQMLNGAKYE